MERLLLLLPPLLPLLWAGSLQKESLYQLQVRGSVTVQEGLCVSVPCNVSYPLLGWTNSTRIYGAWFRKEDRLQEDVLMATDNSARGGKKKRNIPFHLLGDPRANNCSLGIADARKRDSGNYYFQLIREAAKHSYKNNQLTVNVIALTWTPDIHIKEPLESGSSSHLKCSLPEACDWAMPPTISWTGAALRPLGLDSKDAYNSSEILLTPCPQDHGTSPTCRVTFRRACVSAERTITLNVSYPPQKLTISVSGGIGTAPPQLLGPSCAQEEQGLRCSCSSRAQPVPSLRWQLGEGLLEGNFSNASFEVSSSSAGPWANGSLSLREGVSSSLRLSCEALNAHGARSGSVLLLPGKPRLGGEFVLGAIGGAGTAGLLSLCSCLIFFRVKTCRKAAREKDEPSTLQPPPQPASQPSHPGPSPSPGPTFQGYRDECPPRSPLAYQLPAVAAPFSGEEQELHYASLSFLELRPWEPRDQGATSTTEYAEVKILK